MAYISDQVYADIKNKILNETHETEDCMMEYYGRRTPCGTIPHFKFGLLELLMYDEMGIAESENRARELEIILHGK